MCPRCAALCCGGMTRCGGGWLAASNPQTEKIKTMLNNPSSNMAATGDKIHGMKYLLAVRGCHLCCYKHTGAYASCHCQMISKGHDVSEYYADVVKNVIVRQLGSARHRMQFVGSISPAPYLCIVVDAAAWLWDAVRR